MLVKIGFYRNSRHVPASRKDSAMAAGWIIFLLILLGATSPSWRMASVLLPAMAAATTTEATSPSSNSSSTRATPPASPPTTALYWRAPSTEAPTLSPEAAAFMPEIFKVVTCKSSKCTPENSVPPTHGEAPRCQCDDECNLLGECCPQIAPSRAFWKEPGALVRGVGRRYWGCSTLHFNSSTNVTVSMVTRCPKGHVLGRLCERQVADGIYDYKLDLPVLDGKTGVWYQNVFCAVCHGSQNTLRKQYLSFKCAAPNGTEFGSVTGMGLAVRPVVTNSVAKNITKRSAPTVFDNAVDTDGSYETEYGVAPKKNASTRTHDDRSYGYVFQVLQGGKYQAGTLRWVTSEGGWCLLHPELTPPVEGLAAAAWERPCLPLVDRCSEAWTGDREVADLCASYAYHVTGSKTYKNPHCAICNNETVTLRCRRISTGRRAPPRRPPSLRLIMDYEWDPGRDGCISRGGVWDALHSRCQSLSDVCPAGTRYMDGRCVTQVSSAENGGGDVLTGRDDNGSDEAGAAGGKKGAAGELDGSEGDDVDALNGTCLRITLERDEFALENGSLRLTLAGSPFYGLVLPPGRFRLLDDGRAQVCNDYQYALVPTDTVQGYMTAACLAVSAVCLVLHLVVHICLPKLHNLPGKNLQALSAALLLAQLGFLFGVSPPAEPVPGPLCKVIAAAVHFFYLAAFCWMNVMSVDIWRTFSAATGRTNATHRRYALYAWGLPAAVVAFSLAADHIPGIPQALRPGYTEAGICWFGSGAGLGYYLALPVTLILVGNMALFGVTVFQLHRRQEGSRYLRRRRRDERSEAATPCPGPSPTPSPTSAPAPPPAPAPVSASAASASRSAHPVHHGPRDRVRFWLYLKLFVIMGATWLMGTLAVLARWPALWYPFVVLNGLQGAFIFAMFDAKRSVLRLLWERLLGPRPPPALLRSPRSALPSDASRRTATTSGGGSTPCARTPARAHEQRPPSLSKDGSVTPSDLDKGTANGFQQPKVDSKTIGST